MLSNIDWKTMLLCTNTNTVYLKKCTPKKVFLCNKKFFVVVHVFKRNLVMLLLLELISENNASLNAKSVQ